MFSKIANNYQEPVNLFYGYNFGTSDVMNLQIERERDIFKFLCHPSINKLLYDRICLKKDDEFAKDYIKNVLDITGCISESRIDKDSSSYSEIKAIKSNAPSYIHAYWSYKRICEALKRSFELAYPNIFVTMKHALEYEKELQKIKKQTLEVPSYLFEILKTPKSIKQLQVEYMQTVEAITSSLYTKYEKNISSIVSIFAEQSISVHFKIEGIMSIDKEDNSTVRGVYIPIEHLDDQILHSEPDLPPHDENCECGLINVLINLQPDFSFLKSKLLQMQLKKLKEIQVQEQIQQPEIIEDDNSIESNSTAAQYDDDISEESDQNYNYALNNEGAGGKQIIIDLESPVERPVKRRRLEPQNLSIGQVVYPTIEILPYMRLFVSVVDTDRSIVKFACDCDEIKADAIDRVVRLE